MSTPQLACVEAFGAGPRNKSGRFQSATTQPTRSTQASPGVRATSTLALGIIVMASFVTSHRVDAWDQQKTPAPAATVDPTGARVRTEDPDLAAWIRDATDRSTTFRRLVDAIAATDGMVFIVRGRCPTLVRACLVLWMGVAGQYRILRVIVDDRKLGSDAIVSIAHELQHVLEVLSHRSVTNGARMYALFGRIGTLRGQSFETKTAIIVEEAVRSELRRQRSD